MPVNAILSNSGRVDKGDVDYTFVAEHPEIQRVGNASEQRRIDLRTVLELDTIWRTGFG